MNRLELRWQIKDSLRAYIHAAEGEEHATQGATLAADGSAHFPASPQATTAPLTFVGRIELTAHEGLLRISIADPWIHVEPGHVWMTIGDPAYQPQARRRLKVLRLHGESATLEGRVSETEPLSGPPTTDMELTSELTVEGVHVFGGHYPAGTPFAPVWLCPSSSTTEEATRLAGHDFDARPAEVSSAPTRNT